MKRFANKNLAIVMLALVLTALSSVTSSAQKPTDATRVAWSVIASGGIINSPVSNNVYMSATVGQTAIGVSYGGSYKSYFGFWAPIVVKEEAKGVDDPTNNGVSQDVLSNSPNPFVGNTTISYTLPTSGNVTVKVYDMVGRLVRVLVDEFQDAGSQNVAWNGRDEAGNELSAGAYTYELVMLGGTGNMRHRQQLMLLK